MKIAIMGAGGMAGWLGAKLGEELSPDLESQTLGSIDRNPADGKASQLIDLEQSRSLELESLSGTVVQLGHQHSVPTSVQATAYAALKPFAGGKAPSRL